MSFWIRGRKRAGRRFLYSVNVPFAAMIFLVVVVLMWLASTFRHLFASLMQIR